MGKNACTRWGSATNIHWSGTRLSRLLAFSPAEHESNGVRPMSIGTTRMNSKWRNALQTGVVSLCKGTARGLYDGTIYL